MSWQAYVDTNLLASGAVTAAGIYDLQGNPWAYSAGFAAQVAEVASVSAHFPAPTALAATGIVVAGVKYMYVSGDADTEIYGKKGNTGVVFCKCTRDATPARAVRVELFKFFSALRTLPDLYRIQQFSNCFKFDAY